MDAEAERILELMRRDLIKVNDARKRVGSEPLPNGDCYLSEMHQQPHECEISFGTPDGSWTCPVCQKVWFVRNHGGEYMEFPNE